VPKKTISNNHPGPGRPARKRARERNVELLSTALDLFLEHGFDRTSIDMITAAIGMAKRTVYRSYRNKAELFKASLERAIEEWLVPVERLKSVETDDLEETLLRVGQVLVSNVMSPAGQRLLRITNAESGRHPEIGAFTCKNGTEPTLAYLRDLIRRRIRPNGAELPKLDEAALAFMDIVVLGPASLTAWGIALEGKAVAEHTGYCVHLFLNGVLAQDASTGSARRGSTAASQAVYGTQLQTLQEENRQLKILLADEMLKASAGKLTKRAE
jgi:TetR/AcrR family transcriptional regulator, mexJK operon transcriptional repressor